MAGKMVGFSVVRDYLNSQLRSGPVESRYLNGSCGVVDRTGSRAQWSSSAVSIPMFGVSNGVRCFLLPLSRAVPVQRGGEAPGGFRRSDRVRILSARVHFSVRCSRKMRVMMFAFENEVSRPAIHTFGVEPYVVENDSFKFEGLGVAEMCEKHLRPGCGPFRQAEILAAGGEWSLFGQGLRAVGRAWNVSDSYLVGSKRHRFRGVKVVNVVLDGDGGGGHRQDIVVDFKLDYEADFLDPEESDLAGKSLEVFVAVQGMWAGEGAVGSVLGASLDLEYTYV